jgi:hypothetical protein
MDAGNSDPVGRDLYGHPGGGQAPNFPREGARTGEPDSAPGAMAGGLLSLLGFSFDASDPYMG